MRQIGYLCVVFAIGTLHVMAGTTALSLLRKGREGSGEGISQPTLEHRDVVNAAIYGGILSFLEYLAGLIESIVREKRRQNSAIVSFYYTIVKEIGKILVIFVACYRHADGVGVKEFFTLSWDSSLVKLTLAQISMFLLVFNGFNFLFSAWRYSTVGYEKKYASFLECYRLWCDFIVCNRLLEASNEMKKNAAFSMALAMKDSDNIISGKVDESLTSQSSEATLVGVPKKILTNSMSFRDVGTPVAVPYNPAYKVSHNTDLDLGPYCDMVDKFYSVSPKNTYYLDSEEGYIMSIDDVPEGVLDTCVDPPMSDETFQNQEPDLHTSIFQKSSFGNRNSSISNLSSLGTIGVNNDTIYPRAETHYNASVLELGSNSGRRLSVFDFFKRKLHYIVFTFLVGNKTQEKVQSHTRVKDIYREDHNSRNSFRLYLLDQQMNVSGDAASPLLTDSMHKQSYGTLDLEAQTFVPRTSLLTITSSGTHLKNNFKYFMQFLRLCTDTHPSKLHKIDPLFEERGVIMMNLNLRDYILLFINELLWQAASITLYAYTFVDANYHNFYFLLLISIALKVGTGCFLHNSPSRFISRYAFSIEFIVVTLYFLMSLQLFIGASS